MSNLDKMFEAYIKEEGLGRIYTGDNEHVRRIYQDFNDAILFQLKENPKLPRPSLYVTTLSSQFSAFVFREQGHYFIGISIGAIESLFNFFQFLYSQPYFDTGFGDSSKETETALNLSLKPDYFLDYFYNYDLAVKPKCPIRNSYSYQLFYKAINYLLLHEYAHITHGHLDYLARGKKNFLYYENDTILTGNADKEKALEYDADAAASAYSIFDSTFHLLFGRVMLSEHNLNIEIKKSNLAVYFLHKLTELTDIEVEDYTHKTHPISDQRTSNHGAMIQTYLKELLAGEQFDVASVEVFGPSVITEIAMPGYARMFNKEILDDRLLFFHSKQGLPYINAVRKGWNEVRDELGKHSYVKLAPNDELFEDIGLFDYQEILNKKRDNYVDRGSEIQ